MPSYQHNLAPLNSVIKVPLTWTFCMNPEVDSYRIDAHNLTNSGTTYNIKLNIWFLLMGTLYLQVKSLSFRAPPNINKVGTRPSVEPLYKNTQLKTMAQMYQLNINDWVQTSWHYLITQINKAEKIKTFKLTTFTRTQIKQELKRPWWSAPVISVGT